MMEKLKKELVFLLLSALLAIALWFFLPKSLLILDLYSLKKNFMISPTLTFMFDHMNRNALILIKLYIFFIFFYLVFLILLETFSLSKENLAIFLSFFVIIALFPEEVISMATVFGAFLPILTSLMFFYLIYNYKKRYLIALTLPLFFLFPLSIIVPLSLFLLKRFEKAKDDKYFFIVLLLLAIICFIHTQNYYILIISLLSLFIFTTLLDGDVKYIFSIVLLLSFLQTFGNYLEFYKLLVMVTALVVCNVAYKLLSRGISFDDERTQVALMCFFVIFFLSYTLIKNTIVPVDFNTLNVLDEYLKMGGDSACTNSYLLAKSCGVNLVKEVGNSSPCEVYFLTYFNNEEDFESFINSLNLLLYKKYEAIGLITIEENDISSKLGGNIIIYKKTTMK